MKKEDEIRQTDPLFHEDRPASFQAQQTQAAILKAALELFNEQGTGQVTTHSIAGQAEISPGNLYYHFKNKEEIVRTLFWKMELFSQVTWAVRGPLNPKENLAGFMRFLFGELTRYRFFFRDFSQHLRADPILAKLWQIRYEHLFQVMRESAIIWVSNGIMKPFKSPDEVDIFIENFWILANFSAVHLEHRRQSSRAAAQSSELLLHYLYPYHTAKGQRVLDLYLCS